MPRLPRPLQLALPLLVAGAVVGGYARLRLWRARPILVSATEAAPEVPRESGGPVRFLKGQLHLHTNNSADGHASPAEVVRWYASRGYEFIVFTDHNFVTVAPGEGGLLAVPGVELTQNLETCEPAPPPGLSCNLHVNALFVDPAKVPAVPPPSAGPRRLDVYARALEQTAALGGLAQVNHPNFRFGANAEVLTELARRGARLLEVANEASDSSNAGDEWHPSTEALWDAVLTAGATMYAVASDDAHDFDGAAKRRALGKEVYPGDLGFVMVRSTKDAGAIRAALERGDFYASTGVLLSELEVEGGVLSLAVAPEVKGPFQVAFVGERGEMLARTTERAARFELKTSPTAYVRAVVTDARGRKAWTQPLRRIHPLTP